MRRFVDCCGFTPLPHGRHFSGRRPSATGAARPKGSAPVSRVRTSAPGRMRRRREDPTRRGALRSGTSRGRDWCGQRCLCVGRTGNGDDRECSHLPPSRKRRRHRPLAPHDEPGIRPGKIKHFWLIIVENNPGETTRKATERLRGVVGLCVEGSGDACRERRAREPRALVVARAGESVGLGWHVFASSARRARCLPLTRPDRPLDRVVVRSGPAGRAVGLAPHRKG
jgi:hypothetical protein